MRVTRLVISRAALLVLALTAFGQDRKETAPDESQYTVSAKGGAVNVVQGDATLKHTNDWDLLTTGDEVHAGDAIKTGSDGRVEVLLNPGSFIRLCENGEFAFSGTSANDLMARVVKGSAIMEASVVESPIGITVGDTRFSIVRAGIYRFNVGADGSAEALVRKGRIQYADQTVKDGKRIVVTSSASPLIAAFDKKAEDGFDAWSKDRAKTLVAANRRLSGNVMRGVLLGWNNDQARNRNWARNLWIYDARLGGYTFLPFAYGFSSPYGGSYRGCNPNYGGWGNTPGANGIPGTATGGASGTGRTSGGGTGTSAPPRPPTSNPGQTISKPSGPRPIRNIE